MNRFTSVCHLDSQVDERKDGNRYQIRPEPNHAGELTLCYIVVQPELLGDEKWWLVVNAIDSGP